LVGSGRSGHAAWLGMNEEGEIAEGYRALEHGRLYATQLGMDPPDSLPLLEALNAIVHGGVDPAEGIRRFTETFPCP
ncbi:MAG: hypothetical protein WCQ50_21645, partial [Spirochaetota bacterium]